MSYLGTYDIVFKQVTWTLKSPKEMLQSRLNHISRVTILKNHCRRAHNWGFIAWRTYDKESIMQRCCNWRSIDWNSAHNNLSGILKVEDHINEGLHEENAWRDLVVVLKAIMELEQHEFLNGLLDTSRIMIKSMIHNLLVIDKRATYHMIAWKSYIGLHHQILKIQWWIKLKSHVRKISKTRSEQQKHMMWEHLLDPK